MLDAMGGRSGGVPGSGLYAGWQVWLGFGRGDCVPVAGTLHATPLSASSVSALPYGILYSKPGQDT